QTFTRTVACWRATHTSYLRALCWGATESVQNADTTISAVNTRWLSSDSALQCVRHTNMDCSATTSLGPGSTATFVCERAVAPTSVVKVRRSCTRSWASADNPERSRHEVL